MNIPSSVAVCGKRYKIKLVRGMDDSGNMYSHKCLILVDSEQDVQQLRDALLHEIIHVVEYETHLNLKERHVHTLATGLLDVLRKNKKLVEYLTN